MDNENELNADEMETGSEHAGIEAQGATDVSTDPEVVVTVERRLSRRSSTSFSQALATRS